MKASQCCSVPSWAKERISTPAGEVLQVSSEWSWQDRWEHFRARTSEFRMKYRVQRGVYAIGDPGEDSPVLVSANYKLSFDVLRRALAGLDCWILVLDTRAINVWCAAGKGTFGTGQLVGRIQQFHLNELVRHRKLVLPQLGAPGVSAKEIQEKTGFRVYFGPVRAKDLPQYLRDGCKASPGMRAVTFTMAERLVLTPMEFLPAIRKFPLWGIPAIALLGIQEFSPFSFSAANSFAAGILALLTVIAGSVLTPAFLPWIPFRSFALKGWIMGIVTLLLAQAVGLMPSDLFFRISALAAFPLASSYIALQFTGSTPFTHFSGVKRELKLALPVYAAGALLSVTALLGVRLFSGGP